LAQTYANLEIVISDDASTDGTPAICERYASIDPRVRLLRQTTRRGWVGNANLLLHEARGRYAFFAFHDDPVEPTYVEKLAAALESNPRAVVAFSDMHAIGR